ncbi:unnamed protein product, partial [Amoebophrya sp. A25]
EKRISEAKSLYYGSMCQISAGDAPGVNDVTITREGATAVEILQAVAEWYSG